MPAPAQGALAVQCRASDADAGRSCSRRWTTTPTRRAVEAERTVLHALGGGCSVPVGAAATLRRRRHRRSPPASSRSMAPRRCASRRAEPIRTRSGAAAARRAARSRRRRHPRVVRQGHAARRPGPGHDSAHDLPVSSRPPPAPHAGAARARAGDAPGDRPARRAALRPDRAAACASRSRSMPGHARLSPDLAAREAAALAELGVGVGAALRHPGAQGRRGHGGVGSRRAGAATRSGASSARLPELAVWADVCLCEYTDHGHCGVLDGSARGQRRRRCRCSRARRVAYAEAGADVIAPSDMMDGRVGAIRAALDARRLHRHGHRLLRREVRLGVLRPVPRRGRLHAAVRRPARLPDGPAQRARGGARGAAPTSRRARTW